MTESFAEGFLRLEPGRVAVVTIANPARRNAIGRAMWAALPSIAARLAGDATARAVILRAEPGPEGPVFSAGADISEFAEVYATAGSAAAYNALVRAGQAAWAALPLPVIAEIAGACVGGGCGLALSCDVRFAAEGARLGITPARLGIGYSWEDTARLVATVGPAVARDMLFTGRLLPAAEALAAGLVDRVVPEAALAAEVRAWAEAVTELSPASHRITKATINALSDPGPAPADLVRLWADSFSGPDFAEGRAAFLARRRPRF